MQNYWTRIRRMVVVFLVIATCVTSTPVSAEPNLVVAPTMTPVTTSALAPVIDSKAVELWMAAITKPDIVKLAKKYLGVRYRYGSTNPKVGLDCSGFVLTAYKDMNVSLPRTSGAMARTGLRVTSLQNAEPGDILAFGSPVHHVAIYIGNNLMIHSPHTGTVVKIVPVRKPSAIRRVI